MPLPITRTAAEEFFSSLENIGQADIDRAAARSKIVAGDISALSPMEKGEDATQHTKEVYEQAWGRTLKTIQVKVQQRQPFASIVLNLLSNANMTVGGQHSRVSGRIVRELSQRNDLKRNPQDVPYARVGVSNGRYTMIPNIDPVGMVYEHIRLPVKYVVELGSGRGNNLFMLHLRLGRETVRKHYYGLEYTESGRELASTVAALDKRCNLQSHYFNYMEPDISMVPDDAPTVFFSIHSIEQVSMISSKLYDQICARKAPTTLLHFEPVGWQRFKTIVKHRAANDLQFLRAMIMHRLDDPTSEACQVINAAIHSWRGGYNQNLLSILEDYSNRGEIDVPEMAFDFSLFHPVNPTTYIKIVRPKDRVVVTKNQVAESKDQVAESKDQVAESKDQVAESKDQVAEVKDQVAASKDPVSNSKDQAAGSLPEVK